MTGLVLKDIYVLKENLKQYCLICGAVLAYGFLMKSAAFVSIYFVIMGSNLVINTMAVDEGSSFNRFALTMPVDMRMVVRAKYILFLMSLGMGALLSVLSNLLIMNLLSGQGDMFEWDSMAVMVTVFILANSIVLPFMFRLGAEKARYIYIFFMLAMGASVVTAAKICDVAGLSFGELEAKVSGDRVTAFCIVLNILALTLSYLVAVRVAEKKEW